MNYIQLRNLFLSELSELYDKEEITTIFFQSIAHFGNISKTQYLLYPEASIPSTQLHSIQKALEQLKSYAPIQYVLEECSFYGNSFSVNSHTLIPRQETEELVDWIIKDTSSSSLRILDIGTGSGCIAISLAKVLTSSKITAFDISEEALKIARKNAQQHAVSIDFQQVDILNTSNLDRFFDIIVSNPPYVRQNEKSEMKDNVLKFEPHSALFVDDENPLVFYKKISELAFKNLSLQGKLYFEINQYLAQETQQVIRQAGFSCIEVRKDLNGNFRMICAQK